jgi:hypothetical protein
LPRTQKIHGSSRFMRCVIEKDIASMNLNNEVCFKLIYDSSQDGDGSTRLCTKKVYQLIYKGQPAKVFGKPVYAQFFYDLREDYAKWNVVPVISAIMEHRNNLDVNKIDGFDK